MTAVDDDAAAWLRTAEEDANEDADKELRLTLPALNALADEPLWRGLAREPWRRVRQAEARLRARAAEGLSRVRYAGTAPPEEWQPDLMRPPWTADLPGRVAQRWREVAAAEEAAMEVLCSLDCCNGNEEQCWHCWHLDECGSRPAELKELLACARGSSAGSAPPHRARLLEQRWGYLQLLAEAVQAAVKSITERPARVVVLGGAGVTAVAAAKSGAEVTVWEAQPTVADVVRQVALDNGVSEQVKVFTSQDSASSRAVAADICVLEGLEPDGALGSGVLLQLLQLFGSGYQFRKVLPGSLAFSAFPVESRLAEAKGTKVGLQAFARAYGGLAPLPRAAGGGGAAAVGMRRLGEASEVARLDLSGEVVGEGSEKLRMVLAEAGKADALVLTCTSEEPALSFECLHALPAQLQRLEAGAVLEVTASWNPHRFWFEVEDQSLFATVPMPRAHLLDWYSEMMNDAVRNEAFAAGLVEAVSEVKASGKPCRVADLGCGVGLLSALALEAGADEVLGVELTPHLARCAGKVLEEHRPGGAASVRCTDIRAVDCGDTPFDVIVSELLDASGLGEKLVPFMRHAKMHLLAEGGKVVPRRLRIKAALFSAHLPTVAGAKLTAFEPYWLPARASAGEWLAVDLDAGAEWRAASEAVEVFALDFEGPQSGLIAALQEKDLTFPLVSTERDCNAIAWWFEADVSNRSPVLSNAPEAFRPPGAAATHWLQAVSTVGPVAPAADARAARLRVRSDGVHLTWSLLGLEASDGRLCAPPEAGPAPAEVQAWRRACSESSEGLQRLRREAETLGDAARLQALQEAVLAMAAQPGLFGAEAVPEALGPLLKAFFA